MCSVTTFMSFFRILKLRTSPSCWSGTCNYSRLLLNSSFITVHLSDSFTLSFFLSFFFLLVLQWQVTVSDAGRPVFSFGRTLTLMCPLYAVQGCHLYRSILSMMLTMLQSLESFPLHHFLSPKLKFLHAVESLSPCLVVTFSGFFPLNTIPWRTKYKISSWTFNDGIWSGLYNCSHSVSLLSCSSRCVYFLSLSVRRFSLRISIWARWST